MGVPAGTASQVMLSCHLPRVMSDVSADESIVAGTGSKLSDIKALMAAKHAIPADDQVVTQLLLPSSLDDSLLLGQRGPYGQESY